MTTSSLLVESVGNAVPKFKRGDLVRLKSGGPIMTVIGVLTRGDPDSDPWLAIGWKEGDVLCRWLDHRTREVKTHPFEPDWLEAAKK